MQHGDIKRAITPLRVIFAGGLLCLLDFSINGFDILNDFIGMVLIFAGVFQLARIEVHDRYRTAMTVVAVVVVFQALHALIDHLSFDAPAAFWALMSLVTVAGLMGTVLFCVAMRWFCQEARLERAESSFRITTILFVVIYAIPLGLFYIAGTFAVLAGTHFNFSLGPEALLVLLVFLVPMVHLFISTSRMAAEAESSLA